MPKLLTQFSSHANTIADTFRSAFVKTRLGDYCVEMTAPEESTRGGLFGRQHLTLRSSSGLAVVVGHVHAGEKKAEIRSFALVSRVHEERFKKPPAFTEAEYAAFVAKSEPILAAFGLEVRTVHELPRALASDPPEAAASAPPAAWRSRTAVWVLFLVAFVIIAGGGLFWGRQLIDP